MIYVWLSCPVQVVVAAGEYTTGSAWLSEEKLLEQARDMWKRLSDEQKGAYGEDHFEQAMRSLEKYTKNAVSRWMSFFYKYLHASLTANITN